MKSGQEEERKDLLIAYPDMFYNITPVKQLLSSHRTRVMQLVKDGQVHPFDYFGDPCIPGGTVWTIIGAAIYTSDCDMVRVLLPFAGPLADRFCHWSLGDHDTCLDVAVHYVPPSLEQRVIFELLFQHGADPFAVRDYGIVKAGVSVDTLFMKTACDGKHFTLLSLVDHFQPSIADVEKAISVMDIPRDEGSALTVTIILDELRLYISARHEKDRACQTIMWIGKELMGGWQDHRTLIAERFHAYTDLSTWGFANDEERSDRIRRKRYRTDMGSVVLM